MKESIEMENLGRIENLATVTVINKMKHAQTQPSKTPVSGGNKSADTSFFHTADNCGE